MRPFLSYDPDAVAATLTTRGAGGVIFGAGSYYSAESEIAVGGFSDVHDQIYFEGSLTGTLTSEFSNSTDKEILNGVDRWDTDTDVTLPAIACGVTNRVCDTDPLIFYKGNGSALSARVATIGPLPACTAAGSGVGKTLTMNAVGILTVDDVALVLNDKVLVKNQVLPANNGLYKVTTAGTVSVAAVLTRDTAMDATAECVPGTSVAVSAGTVNASTSWALAGDAHHFGISLQRVGYARTRLKFVWASGQGQIYSRRVLKAS